MATRAELTKVEFELLRELEWQGGVLFVDSSLDDAAYRRLVHRNYIYAEGTGRGQTRYELTLEGRHALALHQRGANISESERARIPRNGRQSR